MNIYKVGEIVDSFKTYQEAVKFDIADDGAIMQVFFNGPTQDEICQFNVGNNFELRFSEIRGVMIFTVKIGNLNWMDAPYSPHLSKNLTKLESPSNGMGLNLTLMLIDSLTGEIKHIRLLGLSENFTRKLFDVVAKQAMKEFDRGEYLQTINRIYAMYPTAKIVKMSMDYCKIDS